MSASKRRQSARAVSRDRRQRGQLPDPISHPRSSSKPVLAAIAVVFLLGLWLRVASLQLPTYSEQTLLSKENRWHPTRLGTFLEQDERVYIALVEQLEAGRGYTLQGHEILRQPFIDRATYGRPLFFHPPGGIALFWVMHQIAGDGGFALAQVTSYSIFFLSVMIIASLVVNGLEPRIGLLVATLAATTPIMGHVSARFWLDGPQLAFASAAVALYLSGLNRHRPKLFWAAGVVLGFASLIKLTALLVLAGAIPLALAIVPVTERRELVRASTIFVGAALLTQLPWELWQWYQTGSAFPVWAGKPSPELVRANNFVWYLTEVRSPWAYVELLPKVLWTLVPSLILLAWRWSDQQLRATAGALVAWIAVILAVHIVLGAQGYSKLLRYVILVTPATIVLFAFVVDRALRALTTMAGVARAITIALIFACGVGFTLEVAQGLKTALSDNAREDFIVPLTGLPGVR